MSPAPRPEHARDRRRGAPPARHHTVVRAAVLLAVLAAPPDGVRAAEERLPPRPAEITTTTADGVITLAPALTWVDVSPDVGAQPELVLRNGTDRTLRLEVSSAQVTTDAAGVPAVGTGTSRLLRLAETSVELGPAEAATLRPAVAAAASDALVGLRVTGPPGVELTSVLVLDGPASAPAPAPVVSVRRSGPRLAALVARVPGTPDVAHHVTRGRLVVSGWWGRTALAVELPELVVAPSSDRELVVELDGPVVPTR